MISRWRAKCGVTVFCRVEHIEETVRLTIHDCQPEDEGDYTVKAVNSIGVASCSAEVLVHLEVPTFTRPLEDTPVKVKDTAHLTCQVKGIPRPEVTWFVNDKPVTLGPKFQTTYEGDEATLDIAEVTLEDAQITYTCQASNLAGKASTVAHLLAQGRWPAVCTGLYYAHLEQHVLFCMWTCVIQAALRPAALVTAAEQRCTPCRRSVCV